MKPRLSVAALTLALLLGGCEVDQRMSDGEAMATLKHVLGYEPTGGRVIYAWRHCCALYRERPGQLIPASRCVVYEFSEAEFKHVHKRQFEKVDWSTIDTRCWGPGPEMKGCRGFLPGGLQARLHGEQCAGPAGWRLRIDEAKRVGAFETYTYD